MTQITNTNLIVEKLHFGGGVQRIYWLGAGHGLSVVNSSNLHFYEFAWEAAVITGVDQLTGKFQSLTYDTPLTEDVEVFMSTEDANEFIERAVAWGLTQ
jgi:hypothetical protein